MDVRRVAVAEAKVERMFALIAFRASKVERQHYEAGALALRAWEENRGVRSVELGG